MAKMHDVKVLEILPINAGALGSWTLNIKSDNAP